MVYFSDTAQIPYRYGLDELPADITVRELLYFFSFDHEDKDFIRKKSRFSSYRVVLGIHLGAYRFIGKSEPYPENTPSSIIRFVSNALDLGDGFVPLEYSDRERTRRQHAKITREFLGLSHFSADKHQNLIEYLIQKSPDPGHIQAWINNAEDFLRSNTFVLPSVKALRRLVLSARHQSMERVFLNVNAQVGTQREKCLDAMLSGQGEKGPFWNSFIDKNIFRATPAKLSEVLKRIKVIRELELENMDLSSIPDGYVRHLAQQGLRLSAKQLRDHKLSRRRALMTITLREMESELTDIAIQMNDEILAGVFQRGQSRSEKYLRKYRRVIQQVISAFRLMSDVILNESLPPHEMIESIKEKIQLDKLKILKKETDIIDVPRGSESLYFASKGHNTIQKYLPELLETFKIFSSAKKDPALEAADYYSKRRREGKGGIGQDAPTGFIQEVRWKRVVFDPSGRVKAKPWVLCLADRLRHSFRQGSLEIEGARQYRSLNSDLIPWAEWNLIEIEENKEMPFTFSPEKVVNALSGAIKDLSELFKRWLDEEVPPASIDKKNRLHLTKLDKQSVPDSAEELKTLIKRRMPEPSLSDVFAETDRFVGYSKYFTRLSTGESIQENETSAGQALYALLLAAACNIPLAKMTVNSDINLAFLESIREDILRPQTIQAATAALVDFYSRLPLSQVWGGGGTSSSDGQGFVTAGHPLGAVYHRRRFGRKRRGFIIYTHISDNYAPFYTQVISASAREATYVLDGLLYHGTSLMLREHYTDSHGYTDVVFALTYLLGFRLAPRMAKVPDLTLWYGKGYEVDFSKLFDGRILPHTIAGQWEAMQRIATTIQSGRTRASQIIRKISAFSRKHPLFKAFRNLGRLVRTRHVLEIAGDKEYRRRILQGLNKGESKNSLAKDLRYARRGIIREKDPEMQLNVATSMNFAILCIALWNTIYMQRGIRLLKQEGYQINQEDLRFLSPFTYRHINLYGQFHFKSLPSPDSLSAEKEFEPL